ncbi:MAG: tetratricopeptide repeat protein, partial [Bacteroidota bacterium]|nr:tetratricopeptide repeat protein [Bacteroidota bacterium]
MLPFRSFTSGFAIAILLSACGGSKPVADGAPARPDPELELPGAVPTDKRAEVMRLFMDATQARLAGDLPKAAVLYQQSLKLDPQNDAAMFELGKIYHQSQNFPQAVEMAKRAASTDRENIWYRFFLADLYQQNGKTEDAIGVYKEIVEKWPDRYEVYIDLANSLAYSGKVGEAIRVYADIEQRFGSNEEMIMQQFAMLAGNGKLDEAEVLVKKAIASHPGVPQYQALLAELYDQRGEHGKALELYKQVIAIDPSNSMLRIALAEHYYATGNMEDAYKELGQAFLDPDLDVDAKMQVLIGFFEMTNSEGKTPGEREDLVRRSYNLIEALEVAHPESGKPHTIHGDFLMRDQRFEEAREQFRLALKWEKEAYPIHLQLLQLDLQLGDHEALKADSEEAMSLFPTVPELYLYNGIASSQLKQYDDAATALITGRDLVVDNPTLQAQFWSSLGDTYNASGEHDKSAQAYDRALAIEPDNPNTLNNYAYHLSEREHDLDKAEKMSRRSNELAPNQPSYLDTYAWVLYKLERFADAKTWIQKAMEAGGSSEGVIVEHYGDILLQLGDKAGA